MPCVTLRSIRTDDAELCFLWVNDPDVARYLGLVQAPVSVEQERTWIGAVLADARRQRHFIILDEYGRPIGACGLRRISLEEGLAQLGLFIGDRPSWGKGYGTAATRALLEYAFTELGLQEVRLSCHTANRRAIRCYQRAGFLPSQHHLETSTFGRHEVRMATTRQHWEKVRDESA